MSHKPRIPMRPDELPRQRLYLVRGMPEAPAGWSVSHGEARRAFRDVAMPRSARYLGQVEWSWSFTNMRLSAYYLSMDRSRRHWLLWHRPFDDNWGRWGSAQVCVAAPRQRLPADVAARLLLASAWADERDQAHHLNRFDWVSETGLLEAGDFNEVALAVWGQEDDESDDGE